MFFSEYNYFEPHRPTFIEYQRCYFWRRSNDCRSNDRRSNDCRSNDRLRMIVGAMIVGAMIVGAMIVGAMTVGAMRRPRNGTRFSSLPEKEDRSIEISIIHSSIRRPMHYE